MHWVVTFLLGYISLVACANVTSTATFPIQITTSVTKAVTPLPASSPTPVSTQTEIAPNLHPQVVVLATNLPEPDDLLLAPDGSILVSDVKEGTIRQYGLNGQLHLVLS